VNFEPTDRCKALLERLASYKKPSSVRVVDALPRTAGGKPKKFLLRERFAGAPEVDVQSQRAQ
jgi:acyl-CoA synthetase (AMP-forming)/AMP-acid ligase II